MPGKENRSDLLIKIISLQLDFSFKSHVCFDSFQTSLYMLYMKYDEYVKHVVALFDLDGCLALSPYFFGISRPHPTIRDKLSLSSSA